MKLIFFLFNQRQNIKIKEYKARIKISEFYKLYSSNSADIKLGRRYFKGKYCKSLMGHPVGSNLTLFFYLI